MLHPSIRSSTFRLLLISALQRCSVWQFNPGQMNGGCWQGQAACSCDSSVALEKILGLGRHTSQSIQGIARAVRGWYVRAWKLGVVLITSHTEMVLSTAASLPLAPDTWKRARNSCVTTFTPIPSVVQQVDRGHAATGSPLRKPQRVQRGPVFGRVVSSAFSRHCNVALWQ